MKNRRFSDRIGVTSPRESLQLNEMSPELRNSLWNLLYQSLFPYDDRPYHDPRHRWHATLEKLFLGFFKLPIDDAPFRRAAADWLKGYVLDENTPWFKVYDLLEYVSQNIDYLEMNMHLALYEHILNNILEEEGTGYRMVEGKLVPLTSQTELSEISRSLDTTTEEGFQGANQHLQKAMELLGKRPKPDYCNSIKESISAVESVAKIIGGESGGGLDKAFKILESKFPIHGALRKGFLNLYGYTSDENGIRHEILDEPNVGFDEAKFMLVTCSAFVNYLISKAGKAAR